jgi:ABC-type nitrate/sulfonate/bicarbonate transport system permease component
MGYAMMIAQQSMEPARMLAWLFWIGVVGTVINGLTLRAQQWVHVRMGGVALDRDVS